MGWNNYIVSPKLKAMFRISRDLETVDEILKLGRELAKATENEHDVYDWTAKNMVEQRLTIVADVIKVYSLVVDFHFYEKVFFIGLKGYDEGIYIISELDTKTMKTLGEAGYRVIEE
jgi:hypothetical protein